MSYKITCILYWYAVYLLNEVAVGNWSAILQEIQGTNEIKIIELP